jgi:RimJ/RimL family protein N-acetyltransferase
MRLVDFYEHTQDQGRKAKPEAVKLAWDLLLERPTIANISHRKMPTLEQHQAFIDSEPYLGWFMLQLPDGRNVGTIYITRNCEIGLFILKEFQRKGYGSEALHLLRSKYPNMRMLANVAPGNKGSQEFFERHGFKLIQYTYEAQT